jgi:periplasmic divalent cation tolerance protein
MENPVLCVTALPSEAEARQMARDLVEGRFAACVQVLPVRSTYRWEGELRETAEWTLLCKAPSYHQEVMLAAIKERHPYEVPEILFFEGSGGWPPYLEWLDQSISEAA